MLADTGMVGGSGRRCSIAITLSADIAMRQRLGRGTRLQRRANDAYVQVFKNPAAGPSQDYGQCINRIFAVIGLPVG
eukprot:1312336-Pleurochrysis_carterae.AAC.1